MAKAVWQGSITDAEGDIIPGAQVEFRDADTNALATTYTTRAGLVTGANPAVDGDGDGFVKVYLDQGRYNITATAPGMSRTWADVVLLADDELTPAPTTEATATLSAGDNDNVDPDGWESATDGTGLLLVEAGAGAANLTGLPIGEANQLVTVYNADPTNTVDLVPADTGSTAARRFAGIQRTLLPGMSCQIRYSISLARWILV